MLPNMKFEGNTFSGNVPKMEIKFNCTNLDALFAKILLKKKIDNAPLDFSISCVLVALSMCIIILGANIIVEAQYTYDYVIGVSSYISGTFAFCASLISGREPLHILTNKEKYTKHLE